MVEPWWQLNVCTRKEKFGCGIFFCLNVANDKPVVVIISFNIYEINY